ncbi:MAG: transporter [candidate division WOR-3 bacterium]
MKWLKCWVVILFLLTAEVNATPLIIRTGTVNKPFKVITWLNLGYNQTTKNYGWTTKKFLKEGVNPLATVSADFLASVGLPLNLELGGVVPLMLKSQGANTSQGIGDILIVGRYGILQNSPLPVRAALSLALSLPTGNKTATPALGDGSTDIGFGLALNTIKLEAVVAHLRGAYWFNGKANDTTRLGNMFEYMAGIDFPFLPKLTPQLAFTGYIQEQKMIKGTAQQNTEVNRALFNFLLLYQPIPKITLRPKFSVPISPLCKGETIADYYLGLDAWLTLPLSN